MNAKLTVVERFYYQESPQEEASQLEDMFEVELQTTEEPYQRTQVVGTERKELDFGWFSADYGLVHVRNLGEAYVLVDNNRVPPKCTINIYPTGKVFAVADVKTKVRVTVYPR